ncbi:MAG: VWA domain-containing protein [Acidobacteriota bacterium]
MKFRWLYAFIFLLIISINLSAQDDDIIKVDSSLVVLNATITDTTGKPVRNLKQSQFKILEDGKEQEISFFETEDTPFAAVILIDSSGSMESRVGLARSAAINFLDGLRVDDQVAIYNFDSKVSLIQEFSNSRDIAPNVFELKAYGYTVLNDAIYKAAQDLSNRSEKRKAIIVLSDGADTRSGKSSDKALKAALSVNATIYTVDMSSMETSARERMPNQGILKNFAEKSGGKFIATPGGVALRDAFKNIVEELGVQYTLGFQPKDAPKDGKWRNIELQVAKPNLKIRTRKGYNSEKQK